MQPIGSDTGMKTNSYRGGNDIDMGKAKSKKRGPLIAVAAIAAIAGYRRTRVRDNGRSRRGRQSSQRDWPNPGSRRSNH